MIKLDTEKLEALSGLKFSTPEEAVSWAMRCMDYLFYHNKNLTKEQYKKVDDANAILHSLVTE